MKMVRPITSPEKKPMFVNKWGLQEISFNKLQSTLPQTVLEKIAFI